MHGSTIAARSCLVYYQLGQLPPTGPERARLLLMLRLLSQPLFAELRTQQQLGYAVSSGAYAAGAGDGEVRGGRGAARAAPRSSETAPVRCGARRCLHVRALLLRCAPPQVSGLYVMILSKSYAPPHVQAAIDAYLEGFAAVLEGLADAEFRTSRAALVTRYREPDRTLAEACDRRWRPIEDEHYDFGRRAQLADAIERVSQPEVVLLATKLFSHAIFPSCPRLCVHCFGSAHLGDFDDPGIPAWVLGDDGDGGAEIGDDWAAWRAAQATWPLAKELASARWDSERAKWDAWRAAS